MSTLQFNQQAHATPRYIQVESLGVIEVSGDDTQSFLQGQLTCDVKQASWQQWLPGGYCSPQGKLWATFRLLGDANRMLLFMAKESVEMTLAQLKKFGVFSKVSITDVSDQQPFFAYWGKGAADTFALSTERQALQNKQQHCLRLSGNLVLIHGPLATADTQLMPDTWWHAAQFELGWVDVPASMADVHIPQMLNLDQHEGINFQKGCYLGQEVVARMHYKGQNKRITHKLMGQSETLPEVGARLEKKVSENWRRSGAVLSSVRYDDGVVALYAVGPTDLASTDLFRIQGQDDSQFTLCPEQ
ncbi:hypothetical protein CWE15_03485 [Aliidiomarina taiwanensis]|uniref:tRNA-modifying protein YgfZ-like beta-barrel domain-containing protein n=1 Tax=Aliidiomarina taiwanensis TaxID=946228 RepID=A0A432XA00_9GAMM|nr:hypothetical protein [Aliidiomarina taiwanensis]RUO44243.1 hypothetical protein CWE15_03485 [Aliidiomarina taiwanensis]